VSDKYPTNEELETISKKLEPNESVNAGQLELGHPRYLEQFAQPKLMLLKLRNEEDGEILGFTVTDKFPHLGNVQIEGRLSVEISVELFVELVAFQGYYPYVGEVGVDETVAGVAEDEGDSDHEPV